MQLRTAYTITLATVTAALIALACEPKEPEICVPKVASEGGPTDDNPECRACIADKCGDAGQSCASECEAYGECTCTCDESDLACFDQCGAEKTESCSSCQEASSNAVLSCVTDNCQVCGFGGSGGTASGGDDDGSEGDDDGSEGDDGAACEELHSQCCPQLDAFDRELCDSATDEYTCQAWLEVFQEDGSC